MLDTGVGSCRELLDVLEGQGVKTLVISPGSRNAPLIIGASVRSKFEKLVIPDERTASFVALGISLVSKLPVALICTSGTALYNYAPALAEAYYQHIPLIVVSADRPAQWIDQNDSQTLEQPGALSKIVKESFNIPADVECTSKSAGSRFDNEGLWYVNRLVNEAVIKATTGIPGPVHINIQLGEPLNKTVERTVVPSPRIVKVLSSSRTLSLRDINALASELRGRKVMLVAGFMQPDARLNKAISRFSSLPNVTVLAETISNIHLPGAYAVDSILVKLSEEQKAALAPDIVISIGGALVSRMLKEYLRNVPGIQHWTLADTDPKVDSFQNLTLHIDADPAKFFNAISGAIAKMNHKSSVEDHSAYAASWNEVRQKAYITDSKIRSEASWSELKALHEVITGVPSNCNLFLSNGTCIRYDQLFTRILPHACWCNRGVSGIDGTNATALGTAYSYQGKTILLTGDMSFSYCPEILARKDLAARLKIIVVNNSGGGIFRFIRTTRNLPMREPYFGADPKVPVEALAKTYGWNYLKAYDEESLHRSLRKFYNMDFPILEITVDPDISSQSLISYMQSPKQNNS